MLSSTVHVYTHHSCHMMFRKSSVQLPPAEEDFPFIEQPSDDFFCPVMYSLLLQPHLTACCGKHLSQEAATQDTERGRGMSTV